jgi:hypothetical protein
MSNPTTYHTLITYCEELLNICPISELENHPFPIVREVFNLPAATLSVHRECM